MNHTIKALILVSMTITATLTLRANAHEHTPAAMPAEFDQLKQLVGRWDGKTTMNGQEQAIKVTYELTSGGTAIIERLFAGMPHEMVTVYHVNKKKVALTHYCSLGNQPTMVLKSADAKTLSFEMKGMGSLASPKEPHMHAVSITLDNPNQVTEEWTSFENGKKKEAHSFVLTRAKK